MKKLIRGVIKIPATPFVVITGILLLMTIQVLKFFEWAYEASEYDKKITLRTQSNLIEFLKKWFTTV